MFTLHSTSENPEVCLIANLWHDLKTDAHRCSDRASNKKHPRRPVAVIAVKTFYKVLIQPV